MMIDSHSKTGLLSNFQIDLSKPRNQTKPLATISLSVALLILIPWWLLAQVNLTSSNLPIIVIDTHGQTIVDESRIVADMGVIDNGKGNRNYITDPYNNYDGKIVIELRGSSSMLWPKKQYRVETIDANGEDLDVALLGFPAEADWIFYGPYDDKTFIRNVLPFELSRAIGRYASRTRYFELIINNDYKGIYILMEKIKRDKNRVNIAKCEPQDTSGDALTGGYIIKLDKIEGENVGYWYSPNNIQYQYDYPKPSEITAQQKKYIQKFIAAFESIMKSPQVDDPISGYAGIIDEASFVDYFLLNELARNIDAYRLSAFLYKNRDSKGGKLQAGPIWDMNLTFGHAWYEQDRNLYGGWEIDHNKRLTFDIPKIPFWWEVLVRRPTFAYHAAQRWFALRSTTFHLDTLYRMIDSLQNVVTEAQYRNYLRWPEMGTATTFQQEINYLKNWLALRIGWIDANIEQLADIANSPETGIPQRWVLNQNYPNPFNSVTWISFSILTKAPITIEVFDLQGRLIQVLTNKILPVGDYQLQFDGAQLSSGIYLYRLRSGDFTQYKKMLLVK